MENKEGKEETEIILTQRQADGFLALAREYLKQDRRRISFERCHELIGGKHPAGVLHDLEKKGAVDPDTTMRANRTRRVNVDQVFFVKTNGSTRTKRQIWPENDASTGQPPAAVDEPPAPASDDPPKSDRPPSLTTEEVLELLRREFPTGDFTITEVAAKTQHMPRGTVHGRLHRLIDDKAVASVPGRRYRLLAAGEVPPKEVVAAAPPPAPPAAGVSGLKSKAELAEEMGRKQEEIRLLCNTEGLRLEALDQAAAEAEAKIASLREQIDEQERIIAETPKRRDELLASSAAEIERRETELKRLSGVYDIYDEITRVLVIN